MRLKKRDERLERNRITAALYLVSSIQYEVSDTMHVTKMGTEKKKQQKNKANKPAAHSHIVVTQFQLYEKL